ncbi:hypothetical protein ACWD1Y_20485 [Streptomyces sp. NPDC002814]
MKKGDKLTDTELSQLNHLMKANQNDPVFATRFYQQVGQEGALQMYGQLALQTTDASDKRKALLQEMQRGMGNTLATATDPDNKPHLSEQWSADLRKLGTQHIQLYDDSTREGPYGYQLLGGILRYGNYDSTFLTPVAEHVTQLHAKDPYFFANTKYDIGDPQYGFNPSGKNGAGFDPMNSVLEALSHSPEAATDYFTPPMEAYAKDGAHTGTLSQIGDADSYLDFLVNEDYESFPDITGHDPDAAQKSINDFPDALGNALEAATTGRPADADPSAGPLAHTQEQADLATQVINKFSGPEAGDLLNGEDGTAPYAAARDSLGNIGADYMGDIQRSLTDQDGLPVQGASASLEAEATKEFLYQVSQDPGAYAALTGSQQAYTSGLIEAEINGSDDSEVSLPQRVSSAAHPGAEVAGIMSAARACRPRHPRIRGRSVQRKRRHREQVGGARSRTRNRENPRGWRCRRLGGRGCPGKRGQQHVPGHHRRGPQRGGAQLHQRRVGAARRSSRRHRPLRNGQFAQSADHSGLAGRRGARGGPEPRRRCRMGGPVPWLTVTRGAASVARCFHSPRFCSRAVPVTLSRRSSTPCLTPSVERTSGKMCSSPSSRPAVS